MAHARSRNKSVLKFTKRVKKIPSAGLIELSWFSLEAVYLPRLCSQRRNDVVLALELKKRLSQRRMSQNLFVEAIFFASFHENGALSTLVPCPCSL